MCGIGVLIEGIVISGDLSSLTLSEQEQEPDPEEGGNQETNDVKYEKDEKDEINDIKDEKDELIFDFQQWKEILLNRGPDHFSHTQEHVESSTINFLSSVLHMRGLFFRKF